jgi:hypothetical protein
MTDDQIIKLIEDEFRDPTLSVTRQYLNIHKPVYSNGKIVIARIDRDDPIIAVYLPVEGEKFYFTVYVDPQTVELTMVETEAWHSVYFRAVSESLSIDELMAMTKFKPTEFWNKGDRKSIGNANYQFSQFKLQPNPEPDAFEDKLRKLLDLLEQDKNGIRQLVEKAEGYIQVGANIHNANGMIGGHHIDAESVRRLNDLGLAIDFDLRVSGKKF